LLSTNPKPQNQNQISHSLSILSSSTSFPAPSEVFKANSREEGKRARTQRHTENPYFCPEALPSFKTGPKIPKQAAKKKNQKPKVEGKKRHGMLEIKEDDKGERNFKKTMEPSEENPQKRHGKEGKRGRSEDGNR
jgi:hypothetical protein